MDLNESNSDQTAPNTSSCGAEAEIPQVLTRDLGSIQKEQNTKKSSLAHMAPGIAFEGPSGSEGKAKGKRSGGRAPRQSINIDGKKRYPCPFPGCNKTFSTSGHSSRHSRIHTGEKPYRCTYPNCNAQFSRYDNSIQHYRTHILSSKGTKRGRGKSKGKMDEEGNQAVQDSTEAKMGIESIDTLKRPSSSMLPEVGRYPDQGTPAKVPKLEHCKSIQSSLLSKFDRDHMNIPSAELFPALRSAAPSSLHQPWSDKSRPIPRSYTNIPSIRPTPLDQGSLLRHGYPMASEESTSASVTLDNLNATNVNSNQNPNANKKHLIHSSSFPSYTSSFNPFSHALPPRFPRGLRLSSEFPLSRESCLPHGTRLATDISRDPHATRPAAFQLYRSGSMPSLLSLGIPRSESSHSLSKYSLSSGSPALTPSSSFKGPSTTLPGKPQ